MGMVTYGTREGHNTNLWFAQKLHRLFHAALEVMWLVRAWLSDREWKITLNSQVDDGAPTCGALACGLSWVNNCAQGHER